MDETQERAGEIFCARIAHSSAEFLLEQLKAAAGDDSSPRELRQIKRDLAGMIERVEVLRRVHDFAGFRGKLSDAHRALIEELLECLERTRNAQEPGSLEGVRQLAVNVVRRMIENARDPAHGQYSSSAKFTFVHFTDLHWSDRQTETRTWCNIEERLFRSFDDIRKECGAVDAVLFSGDLVKTGRQEEFDSLNCFFERLWKHIPGDPPLFAIPGNHDLFRPAQEDMRIPLFTNYPQDPNVQKLFWGQPDSDFRRVVTSVFHNFSNWWDGNLEWQTGRENKLQKAKMRRGILPGDFSYCIEKEGRRVGIVGLNTSFLQVRNGIKKGQLGVSSQQLHRCFCDHRTMESLEQNDTNLLMTHHPKEWLCEDSVAELDNNVLCEEWFNCHFCGHLHVTAEQRDLGPTGQRHHFQGPSLFSLVKFEDEQGHECERFTHGYSVIDMRISDHQITSRVWPRLLANKGWWREDSEAIKLEGKWSKSWSTRNLRFQARRS